MLGLKLKAGALQLTTFIIVVIALLLTAFILLVHVHKQFRIQSNFTIETTKQSNQGVNYTLQNPIRINDTTTINFQNEDDKTLRVYRNFWGVFEKVVSTATIKNKHFEKLALVGSKQSENNRTALYVQDNNKPLVLVGNTKIKGLTYLPRLGVKPGYISGQSYYGSKLIYGTTRVASRLPKLSLELINHIEQLEYLNSKLPQSQFLNIEEGGNHSNSFLKPLQVIYSNNAIDLRSIQLTGHILLQSKSKITVHPSSNLRDVVLIAPEIEIKPNVVGNFQAIASKEIIVANNVQLNFPSALVLNEKREIKQLNDLSLIEEEHKISINENSTIKGSVVFIGQDQPNNYKPQIVLKEKATL